mgnify:CR=1 FL=1
MIQNKRILITGGAGSIGSELYRQLAEAGNTVMAMDINETALFDLHEEYRLKGYDVHYRLGDIRDQYLVDSVFDSFKPEVVFHCAALKHVTPNEAFPRETVKTNIMGTLNVLSSAKYNNVPKLVYISTDKVVNSNCIMGISKRFGEVATRNIGYVAVRFGNVMRSRGSVLEIWERQLSKNEPITITDERMERLMMSIPQACELLIKACEIGEPGELLVMDMGRPVKIIDLAKKFLEEHGKVGYPINVIGIRPGEQLSERLMTPEEEMSSIKKDNFIIIK